MQKVCIKKACEQLECERVQADAHAEAEGLTQPYFPQVSGQRASRHLGVEPGRR